MTLRAAEPSVTVVLVGAGMMDSDAPEGEGGATEGVGGVECGLLETVVGSSGADGGGIPGRVYSSIRQGALSRRLFLESWPSRFPALGRPGPREAKRE
jgi:hypothetical protein